MTHPRLSGTDFILEQTPLSYILLPISDKAKEWAEKNLDNMLTVGVSYVPQPQEIPFLLKRLAKAGFQVEEIT